VRALGQAKAQNRARTQSCGAQNEGPREKTAKCPQPDTAQKDKEETYALPWPGEVKQREGLKNKRSPSI
jgi:hypothetical protein